MKKIKITSIAIISLLFVINQKTFGQKNLLYFSVGNNGQINNEINDFYNSPSGTRNFYSSSTNTLVLSVKINYEYLIKNNFAIGAKSGFTLNTFSYKSIGRNLNYNSRQEIYPFSISVKYLWNISKLQFSTGLELPYYKVNDYKYHYSDVGGGQTMTYDLKIDGGNVLGINNISSIKFFITDKIFIASDVSFGFLVFSLGGKNQYTNYINNSYGSSITTGQFENSHHKIAVSNPEFYFGIGLKL